MMITMKEDEMNEPSQIRERFLADARQHFFADHATSGKTQSAARLNNNPCRCGTNEQRFGQSGA